MAAGITSKNFTSIWNGGEILQLSSLCGIHHDTVVSHNVSHAEAAATCRLRGKRALSVQLNIVTDQALLVPIRHLAHKRRVGLAEAEKLGFDVA